MTRLLLVVTFVAVAVGYSNIDVQAGAGEALQAPAYEILGTMGGAYFGASTERAVILVPGVRYDKASWFFLSGHLQGKGIASIALDSGAGISRAIGFLKEKGYAKITLLGASMGGGAVTDEVQGDIDGSVDKVVLLAPYGGQDIMDSRIGKLFIVAKDDPLGLYSDVLSIYEGSAAPKKLKVFESSGHAQELFESADREALISLITEFISE